jgi:uncharacterized surface protein with fasciclin (FAS1) repeats
MRFLLSLSLLALPLSTPALAGDATCAASSATVAKGEKDVVDTAVAAGTFQTLVAAVKAAGLAETLKGKGPFTVFAPTDEAFAKLPKGTLERLLRPENKQELADILTYHVVAGAVGSGDAKKLDFAPTVLGQALRLQVVEVVDGARALSVDGATVVQADIACANGVIHVIDRVVLPRKNIVETAAAAGTFQTLLAAAKAAGLVEALSGGKPVTVFAPTDAAFARLPAGTVDELLLPESKERLAALLKYHVVPGRVLAKDVVAAKSLETLNGKRAPVVRTEKGATVAGVNIVTTDLLAANGVIHVVDAVMLP